MHSDVDIMKGRRGLSENKTYTWLKCLCCKAEREDTWERMKMILRKERQRRSQPHKNPLNKPNTSMSSISTL